MNSILTLIFVICLCLLGVVVINSHQIDKLNDRIDTLEKVCIKGINH